MWSYRRLGITPDIVTLGKPMGNGHPVAAVITRRDIAERFGAESDFFSTFGGNPVAMAAALAVLEVIEDERIIAHVGEVGGSWRPASGRSPPARPRSARCGRSAWRSASRSSAPARRSPIPARPARSSRACGSAACSSARPAAAGSTLKIRPPLVIRASEARQVVATLDEVVAGLAAR